MVVRSYLRSPFALFTTVALLTAGQGLVMVVGRSERWAGHWPSTSAVVGWATLWGACLAAGAAAWVVAAPRRAGFQDLLTAASRSRVRIHARPLAAVALGSLAGYVLVLLYAVTITAGQATHGRFDPLEVLPTVAAVPAAVGAGALLGRWSPPVIAPLVGAVSPYLVYMWATYADAYLDRLLFTELLAMDEIARDYLAVPPELLVAKTLFAALGGAALLSWVVAAPRTGYVLSVLTGFALAGVFLVAGVRIDVPTAYQPVCRDGAPTVCLDRAHAPQLVVPTVKGHTDPAHEIDMRQFTARLGHALFLAPCEAGDDPGWATGIVLYHWWLTHHRLPVDGGNYPGEPSPQFVFTERPPLAAVSDRFMPLSGAERDRWFSAHRADVLTCSADLRP